MLKSRIGASLAAAVCAFLFAGCHSGPKRMSLEVPLRYNATERLSDDVHFVEPNPNLKLFIEVTDGRSEKAKIGQNLEEDNLGPRPITGSGQPPAEFVAMVLSRNFPTVGVNVVTERAQANRVLNFSLTQFFVTETTTYKAAVGGTATLSDGSGKQLWSAAVNGSNDTFGRSMNPENYTQTLTNASIEIAEYLLKTPAFTQALKVQ